MSSSMIGEQQPWTDQVLLGQMNVLNSILQSTHVDLKYMSGQCLLLSRILDSLVANNWKPSWRSEVLPLVRKACKYWDSQDARSSLLLLLLSVKAAVQAEWLTSAHVTENDEIFKTMKRLFDSFTTSHDVSGQTPMQLLQCGGSAAKDFQEASGYLVSISNRFYPRLQVNSIFVAVHAKVGYEVLMCDFNVPRMHVHDRVRLFVGQKDSIETSKCIITPPKVNFLVNGHQVERRVATGYMDGGPQMPSDVTHLVKVGPNVLQAIGEFSVSYVIAIASSRAIERSAKNAELQDYVTPTRAASEGDLAEVDDEVVEGASRVSLRCPISHQRLVLPVKAASCRHLQCFDYDSFLEINENRPAWRCPCCNSFISCPDLRIDRQMENVLKGTDEKIYEVIINQDRPWVPVLTEDEDTDRDPNDAMVEGADGGSKYIDLSDVEDEPSITWQPSDVFQQHERKPDLQTLHAMAETRGNVSHPNNPVVGHQGSPVINERRPVVSVPDFTSVASQSSPSTSGHLSAGGISEGLFVNATGGDLYTTTSRTVDSQLHNQPSPSIQSLSAVNHNFQVRFPESRTASHLNSQAGPVNRISSSSGHIGLTQIQPPQGGTSPNIGLVLESERVRQRQVGQHSPGSSQQNDGQMRPQWRSTGVQSPQLGINAALPRNLQSSQHVYSNQTRVSLSPRQHLTPGNLQQQRPTPGTNLHPQHAGPGTSQQQSPSPNASSGTSSLHLRVGSGTSHQQRSSSILNSHQQHAANLGTSHQRHSSPGVSLHQLASLGNAQQQQQRPSPGINSQQSPGINSQQRPAVWGAANTGQWRSTNNTVYQAQAQALGAAAVAEQSWPLGQRMRGSIANPLLGPVALGTSTSAAQPQRAPPVTAFPSVLGFNTATGANSVPVPRFQVGIPVLNNQQATNNVLPALNNPQATNNIMPALNNPQATNNVALYNGTTWVSAPDFSSTPLPAPRFTGLETAEGWINFEDIDLPELPR